MSKYTTMTWSIFRNTLTPWPRINSTESTSTGPIILVIKSLLTLDCLHFSLSHSQINLTSLFHQSIYDFGFLSFFISYSTIVLNLFLSFFYELLFLILTFIIFKHNNSNLEVSVFGRHFYRVFLFCSQGHQL